MQPRSRSIAALISPVKAPVVFVVHVLGAQGAPSNRRWPGPRRRGNNLADKRPGRRASIFSAFGNALGQGHGRGPIEVHLPVAGNKRSSHQCRSSVSRILSSTDNILVGTDIRRDRGRFTRRRKSRPSAASRQSILPGSWGIVPKAGLDWAKPESGLVRDRALGPSSTSGAPRSGRSAAPRGKRGKDRGACSSSGHKRPVVSWQSSRQVPW